MKSYWVEVPFTGSVGFRVTADDEEGALEEAFNTAFSLKLLPLDDEADMEITDFELHERVVRGNVFYGCLDAASVVELDSE